MLGFQKPISMVGVASLQFQSVHEVILRFALFELRRSFCAFCVRIAQASFPTSMETQSHAPNSLRLVLQRSLDFVGLGDMRFSSHSFRIGAATSAAMSGIPEADISNYGALEVQRL